MSERKIWLMNHYASNMFRDKAGRHYWFAQKLIERGYDATVFCSTTLVNGKQLIDTGRARYVSEQADGVPFVLVKTVPTQGNGIRRIRSMVLFYRRLFPAARAYAKKHGKPDVILASSVHPLTMVAGIRIARRLGVPCICEIRDLWPEAIFNFRNLSANSLIGRILTKGEHWIYKRADALIFTKEGDTDYLKEKGWTTEQGGDIDLKKCHYINNGVDLAAYADHIVNDRLDDPDVCDETTFKVTYCGTVRPVNNVGKLLDAAAILKKESGYEAVRFLIFGDGAQLPALKKRVEDEALDSVKIKGFVERKYVPFLLSRSDLNVLNYSQSRYNWTRGNSSNKLFEYMASGKPVLSTVRMGYSVIRKYDCGAELAEDTPEALAEEIKRFYRMSPEERKKIGENAKTGVEEFDVTFLTEKLLRVIESVV